MWRRLVNLSKLYISLDINFLNETVSVITLERELLVSRHRCHNSTTNQWIIKMLHPGDDIYLTQDEWDELIPECDREFIIGV